MTPPPPPPTDDEVSRERGHVTLDRMDAEVQALRRELDQGRTAAIERAERIEAMLRELREEVRERMAQMSHDIASLTTESLRRAGARATANAVLGAFLAISGAVAAIVIYVVSEIRGHNQ